MLDDFVALQKEGRPLPEIIATLADKYNYSLKEAVAQGKQPHQIIEDLLRAKPEDTGVLAPMRALLRGGAKGIYADIPEMTGKALQATGIPGIRDVGKFIRGVGEAAGKRLESRTPRMGRLSNVFYQAGEMMAPSYFGGALGAAVGRATGIAKGLEGAQLAERTIKGAALGGGTLFGASQAREAYENALKRGVSPTKAVLNGLIQGTLEFGGEYYGTKYLAKMLGLGEQEVKGITKKIARKLRIPEGKAARITEALGVEVGTEVGQQFTEELTDALIAASPKKIGEIVADSLSVAPPTVLMTILTGTGGRLPEPAVAEGRPEPSPKRTEPIGSRETVSLVPTRMTGYPPGMGGPRVDVTPVLVREVKQLKPPESTALPTGYRGLPPPIGALPGPSEPIITPPPAEVATLFTPPPTEVVEVPALPAPPATLEEVVQKAKYLDRNFNVHSRVTKTKTNMVKKVIKELPQLAENADEHAAQITGLVKVNSAQAQQLLDSLKDADKDTILSSVQDIVSLSRYMSNRQLEEARKILQKVEGKEDPQVKKWRNEVNRLRRAAIQRYNQNDYAGFSEMASMANELEKNILEQGLPSHLLPEKSEAFQTAIKEYVERAGAQPLRERPPVEPQKEEVPPPQTEVPEFANTEEALAFGPQATPDQLRQIAERYIKKGKEIDKLGKPTTTEGFNRFIEMATAAQFDREALESAGYEINQKAKTLRSLFKGKKNVPEWAKGKPKPKALSKKRKMEIADDLFPDIAVSSQEVVQAKGDYLLATIKKAQEKGREIPKYLVDYYKERGINILKFVPIKEKAIKLEKPKEGIPKTVTPTHGILFKGSSEIKLVKLTKENKKSVQWVDEYGKRGMSPRSKIASIKPITKVKEIGGPVTQEELQRLQDAFAEEPSFGPVTEPSPLTTVNSAIDSINFFLVNKLSRQGVLLFKDALRAVKEQFRIEKYSDKDLIKDVTEVQRRLKFKSEKTSSKNPLHTRLIGTIKHIDNMLTDEEFLGKLQMVNAVVTMFNEKFSEKDRALDFPSTEKIISELKSFRTYLDSFFTDFISAVSSVGKRQHGVTQRGFIIKDAPVKKEGNFLTVLYSQALGKDNPKYAIIQKRGNTPFIVKYDSLPSEWRLTDKDKKARNEGILGTWGELPAQTIKQYDFIRKQRIQAGFQAILQEHFNLSPIFSQFFTGRIYQVAAKEGIQHEGTAKEVAQGVPIKPLTKPKSKPKTKVRKKSKSIEDINRVLKEILTSKLQADELAYTAGLSEVAPKWTSTIQDPLLNKIESYIEHILGNKAKVFIGDIPYLVKKLKEANISKEEFISILTQGQENLERYKDIPFEAFIASRLRGFTTFSFNGFTLIFVRADQKNARDVIHTAFHEIMENLWAAKYISRKEYDLLIKEYKGDTEALSDAFADFMLDREGFEAKTKSPIIEVFDKIKAFLTRLRNYLNGLGFRNAQDVFEAAAQGKFRQTIPYEVLIRQAPPAWERIATQKISEISIEEKVKESVGDTLRAIWKGLKDTVKDPRLGRFEKWVVPPQWHSHPIIQSIFGIVEDGSEKSWEAISEILEPVIPVLKTLSKKEPERYKKLTDAVIASDKASVYFNEDALKEDFGLDDELIGHYHLIKQTFDTVLDKFFDSNERTVLGIIHRRYAELAQEMESAPENFLEILNDLDSKLTDFSLLQEILSEREQRISDYKAQNKGEISNRTRGLILRDIVGERVAALNIENDAASALLKDYLLEAVRSIMPMERQRAEYKDGFYFPRVRPAGDFAVKVMMADTEQNPETGETTLVWREVDRFHTNPGPKSKQNVQKQMMINREKKKYGDRAIVVKDKEEFQRIKDSLQESQVVILAEPIIRTPNTFFEGVNNRSILNYLSYITTKLEKNSKNPEAFKDILRVLHNEIDEDLKARSFARSRWIKRQSGQIDIEALLRGAEETGQVVGGYQTDLYPVIRSYTIAEMRNIARNDVVNAINVLINREDIKEQILDDAELYDWYKRYVDGVMSPDTPLMRYSRAVKSLISLWYLGGRISSAAVQMTQVYVTGGPELAIFENASKDDLLGYRGTTLPLSAVGEHLSRQTKSAKRLTKALTDIVTKKLSPEEKRALQKGIRSKVLQSQFINSLMEMDDRILGRTFTQVVNLGMKFFQFTEQKSREVGYIAAFRIAREKGLSYDEALDFATNFTNTAFHIYSSTNKPLFATGKSGIAVLSSIPMALKGYQINFLGWIYKAFKNEYGKKYADKAIFSSVYMALLGGLWAIPLLGDIIDLLSSYLGIPLKKKIQSKITTNTRATKAIEFGLPASFLGIDFSGSARLDLLPRELSVVGIVDNLLGVWTSAGQKITRAKLAYDSDQYVRAVESLAPVAIENMIKALRYGIGKEELKTIYGKTVVDQYGQPVKPSVADSGLMLLGFRPVNLSEISSIYQATRTIENYWRTKHDRIFTKLKTAKDYKALSRIISEDVNAYNEGVAKYGGAIPFITTRGILRALKNAKGAPMKLVNHLT